MGVKAIPEGFNTFNLYLGVDDAKKAIEFYKRAFGATERAIMPGPNDTIGHAELLIGDSVIMLSDPFPQSPLKSPKEAGGTTASPMILHACFIAPPFECQVPSEPRAAA